MSYFTSDVTAPIVRADNELFTSEVAVLVVRADNEFLHFRSYRKYC